MPSNANTSAAPAERTECHHRTTDETGREPLHNDGSALTTQRGAEERNRFTPVTVRRFEAWAYRRELHRLGALAALWSGSPGHNRKELVPMSIPTTAVARGTNRCCLTLSG